MTPAELPAYLQAIRDRAAAAMVPVADAMGDSYKEHLTGFTLHESGAHPPVTQTPAAPGRPPAFMTGGLAASVVKSPAAGGPGYGECTVVPLAVYAGTQEYGGVHAGKPFMALWIRYIGYAEVKRRKWLRRTVSIPARPFMSVAVAETVANGDLQRAAMEAFEAVVWGGE